MPTTLFPQLSTIPAFQQIGYFHLGSVREYEANGRTVMEGEFVDYRPPTPERRPFRFHVAHGADLKLYEPQVRERINAKESLLDIYLG